MPQSIVKVMNKKGITGTAFNEMLYQVKVLLTIKGICSEEEIKNQFRNLAGSVVETFLVEAIKRGIIKKEDFGTYTFRS